MKQGDYIRNTKTNKIGVVIDANYAGYGILKYYLIDNPSNTHICINPKNRFVLYNFKEKCDIV